MYTSTYSTIPLKPAGYYYTHHTISRFYRSSLFHFNIYFPCDIIDFPAMVLDTTIHSVQWLHRGVKPIGIYGLSSVQRTYIKCVFYVEKELNEWQTITESYEIHVNFPEFYDQSIGSEFCGIGICIFSVCVECMLNKYIHKIARSI